MPTDRLTLEQRPAFERTALVLMGMGLLAGATASLYGPRFLNAPSLLTGVALVALLAPRALRGDDDVLPTPVRMLFLGLAAAMGVGFNSLAALALALGGFAGLSLAGTAAASARRRLTGAAAGAAGIAWGLAVLPSVLAQPLPAPGRAVVAGVAAGLFAGMGMLGLHVKVHADALMARLQDERLKKAWGRCHAALRGAPPAEKQDLLRLLRPGVEKAGRLTEDLQRLDARLAVVDRKDAEAQVAALKADAAAAGDATARQQLQHAAASLGDSLEALDALERKRERLDADLRLELATLERAALSLESAQGAVELRALAIRLTAPSMTHPA